jgi:ADP-ribose pyrophosphatase YjhB (NUDIX family)/N-acetylglutamate synthase-like GNAT family acetyltransferase
MPKQTLKYCPICSTELIKREEGGRLRSACDNCGYVHYVNPVPGVGLLIEKDGGLVLIKRGHPPHKDEWTLPSGFVEADESAEEAAIREAEEETGLKVEIIELAAINSFPEGPPVSGIMIFYRMRPIGGELQAGDDAIDAKVFAPQDLPLLPFRTHREMVAEWLDTYSTLIGRESQQTTSPEFTIRSARDRDLDEVLALLGLIPQNRNLTQDEWQAIILRFREVSTVEVYVAESSVTGVIMGCVTLSVIRSLTEGMGLINDMAVLPTYQRQGVGAELLEAVMRRASELNLRSLWVNQQRANDQARAFYSALGFSQGGILQLKIR